MTPVAIFGGLWFDADLLFHALQPRFDVRKLCIERAIEFRFNDVQSFLDPVKPLLNTLNPFFYTVNSLINLSNVALSGSISKALGNHASQLVVGNLGLFVRCAFWHIIQTYTLPYIHSTLQGRIVDLASSEAG